MPNLEVMMRLANALSKFTDTLFKDEDVKDSLSGFMTQDLQDSVKEIQTEAQKAYNEGDFHGYLRANVQMLEILMPDLEQAVGWQVVARHWPNDARNGAMIKAVKFYGGENVARVTEYSYKPPSTPPNNNGGGHTPPGFGPKGGFGPLRPKV